MKKAHERSHYRFRRITPAFPAQWFYGLLRALPGDQACLTPSPALLLADLTPALGRQNDTTSPSAELSPNFGDGLAGQAAAVVGSRSVGLAMTSIPSLNVTPRTSFGNWLWPSRRRQLSARPRAV